MSRNHGSTQRMPSIPACAEREIDAEEEAERERKSGRSMCFLSPVLPVANAEPKLEERKKKRMINVDSINEEMMREGAHRTGASTFFIQFIWAVTVEMHAGNQYIVREQN